MTLRPFKPSITLSTRRLEFVHSYVCGPMQTESISDSKYCLKKKSEVSEHLNLWLQISVDVLLECCLQNMVGSICQKSLRIISPPRELFTISPFLIHLSREDEPDIAGVSQGHYVTCRAAKYRLG